MRPVLARRITQCYYCKDPIVKGSQRLTDHIRIKANNESGYMVIRRHFHFRKEEEDAQSCHDKWMVGIFERMPALVPRNTNPRGRPLLDLTQTQRETRRTLMKKWVAQVRYYITEGNLDLSRPVYLTDVTLKDVRKATRFRDNLANILEALEKVGGIPEKYKVYMESPEAETEMEEQVA